MNGPSVFSIYPEDWDYKGSDALDAEVDEPFQLLLFAFRRAVELSSSASSVQSDFIELGHEADPFFLWRELATAFAHLLASDWLELDSAAASMSGLVLVPDRGIGQDCPELRSELVPSISSLVAMVHPQHAPPENVLLWEA